MLYRDGVRVGVEFNQTPDSAAQMQNGAYLRPRSLAPGEQLELWPRLDDPTWPAAPTRS